MGVLHRKPINKKGHFSAKKPGYGGKRSPVAKGWDEKPFTRNMDIVKFLKLMTRKMYADIIESETRAKSRKGSESALSMIEYCFADDTDECSTYKRCLLHVLHSRFTDDNYTDVYKVMAVHLNSMFPEGTSLTSRNQYGTDINNTLRDAEFHEDEPIEERELFMDFPEVKLVALSGENKDKLKTQAEESRSRASANPNVVPEKAIVEAAMYALDLIARSKDAETVIMAKCFLLLLSCGTRPKGLFTQRFAPLSADIPNVPLVGDESPMTQFMTRIENIIAYTRAAKEGSKAKRAKKATKKKKQTKAERKRLKKNRKKYASGKEEVEEGDDEEDEEDDDDDEDVVVSTDEIIDKWVTLPLLPFLSREKFFKFKQDVLTAKYTTEMLKLFGLPIVVDNWTDALVRGQTKESKGLDEFIKEFFKPVGVMVKTLFKGYTKKHGGKSVKGASFLRPLYGNYAFAVFGGRTHNLAFLANVLGHANDITSRNYQWLIVDMIIRAEQSLSAQMSSKLAEIEVKVEQCCDDAQRGQKRRREDDDEEDEKKGEEAEAAEKKKKKVKKAFALPKADGTYVTIQPKKWGRVRGGTAAEREAQKLADYTDWVNTVLKPAGVDMRQINQSHATMIGRRPEIITAYSKANGIPVQERRKK